jgi:hypothetical protein
MRDLFNRLNGKHKANRLRKLPGGLAESEGEITKRRNIDLASGSRTQQGHPAAYAAGSPVVCGCVHRMAE